MLAAFSTERNTERGRPLDRDQEFLGARPPNEVKRQLDQARVFCLPSARTNNGQVEGFGMVLLEAQASGVPVVTYRLGSDMDKVTFDEIRNHHS